RTLIDPWFLHQIREIVEMEDRLRTFHHAADAPPSLWLQAKQYGFSDHQLAHLWHTSESEIRRQRLEHGIVASFKLVDTCAAEFEAYTPYYYSTYESGIRHWALGISSNAQCPMPNAQCLMTEDETRPPSGKERIMILGGGPNRIGQGIEFDYCCCQAAF